MTTASYNLSQLGSQFNQGGTGAVARTTASKLQESVSVLDFGADPTGATDSSTAISSAITALGTNGTLVFPPGTYKFNVDVGANRINFRGAGINATTLQPNTSSSPIITISNSSPAGFFTIENITLSGSSGLTGNGVQFGHSVYVTNDQLANKAIFKQCRFVNFNAAIARLYGNIEIYVFDCVFETANYHLYNVGLTSPLMHAGTLFVSNCIMSGAALASVYMDSAQSGTAQVVFKENIFDGNPGFVFFVYNFNDVGGAPGFSIQNNWNENNYTSSSVTINSTAYTPGLLYARNTQHIRFDDSYMGPVTLVASNLITNNCVLDTMTLTEDSASSCVHDNAVYDSGKAYCGLVRSIRNMSRVAGGYASATQIAHRFSQSKAWNSQILYSQLFGSPVTFSGTASLTTSNATDGVLQGQTTVQDLAFTAAQTELPSGGTFSVSANRYLVWLFTYKLISGPAPVFNIVYNATVVLNVPCSQTTWTTIGGITNTFGVAGLPDTAALYLQSSAACTLRMALFEVVSFTNQQDAINFLNSGAVAI